MNGSFVAEKYSYCGYKAVTLKGAEIESKLILIHITDFRSVVLLKQKSMIWSYALYIMRVYRAEKIAGICFITFFKTLTNILLIA